jgi:hypothetical protein
MAQAEDGYEVSFIVYDFDDESLPGILEGGQPEDSSFKPRSCHVPGQDHTVEPITARFRTSAEKLP